MNDPLNPASPSSLGRTVSPDSLMSDFRGRSLSGMVILAVVAHVLFVGVFSLGYLARQIFGKPTSAMTEQQRLDEAVRESTTELRRIAERYDIKVQDLSQRFAGGAPGPAAPTQPATTPPPTDESHSSVEPTAPSETEPAPPTSEIERTLQQKEVGPSVPDLKNQDDLFAPKSP